MEPATGYLTLHQARQHAALNRREPFPWLLVAAVLAVAALIVAVVVQP